MLKIRCLISPLLSIYHATQPIEIDGDLWNCFEELASAASVSQDEEKTNCDELQTYYALPRINHDDDWAQWWRAHKTELPQLFELALRFMTAPCSTVYSERMFSEAGLLYEKKRNRLKPRKAEKLLFLHYHLKSK